MNPDFEDFLRVLTAAKVRFVVVGAHALAVHGVPRSTGDIDILIERSAENAERVWTALTEFGAPTDDYQIATHGFFSKPACFIRRGSEVGGILNTTD